MSRRPAGAYALLAALGFQGLSAVGGGLWLVADPSGEAIGLPISSLQGSPFDDYLVPGLVLLVLLGVAPLVVAYGVWAGHSWSRAASLFVGVALVAWIGVQVAVIGYGSDPPLQLLYGAVGVLIVVLSRLPSVRRYLGGRR